IESSFDGPPPLQKQGRRCAGSNFRRGAASGFTLTVLTNRRTDRCVLRPAYGIPRKFYWLSYCAVCFCSSWFEGLKQEAAAGAGCLVAANSLNGDSDEAGCGGACCLSCLFDGASGECRSRSRFSRGRELESGHEGRAVDRAFARLDRR